jgi:TonB family protein
MAKVVKLCGHCDEGFAEKFDRCPKCGSPLQAFRLEQFVPAVPPDAVVPDANYSVTVIAQKDLATRNALFAGALVFVLTALLTGTVVNLFSKDLDVGSIDGDIFNAVIVDEIPEPVDDDPLAKTEKDKGGGGGGDNDPTPASRGDRAPMRTRPQIAPSVSMDRLTNPTMPIQMAIKGPINERIDTTRYGVKLGGDTPSDGPGSMGGQGTGRLGGQGPGLGPGSGPGKDGGLGGKQGGIPGSDSDDPDDGPPPVRGISTPLKIISKPRPGYTDAARLHAVQGEVKLRVTFLSNGTVGNVTVVQGLPDGLTELALLAAKRIVFEPAMVNGKPQSVTRQLEYSFYIY